MSQACVEILIGRLVTDRGLRLLFDVDPQEAIQILRVGGLKITDGEADALSRLDSAVLETLARALDPRLRRACLRLSPAERQDADGASDDAGRRARRGSSATARSGGVQAAAGGAARGQPKEAASWTDFSAPRRERILHLAFP